MLVETKKYTDKYPPVDNLPADLISRLQLIAQIIRYQVDYYPQEIFADQTDLLHTSRMVRFWLVNAPRELFDIQVGERMLWLHDILENHTGDHNAVEVANNSTLSQEKEAQEDQLARQDFSSGDYELFARFNSAANFWRGSHDDVDTTALAVVLIDKVDGNVVFHEKISRLCELGGTVQINPSINKSFLHTNIQASDFLQRLHLLPENYREWFAQTILSQFDYIESYWLPVPQERIPEEVKKALQEIPQLRNLKW